MNLRVTIRPAADADIDESFLYIARDGVDAALRFLEATERTFLDLAGMPHQGHLWNSELGRLEQVRVWPVKGFENWLVFYRSVTGGIEVLHVLHGARDLSQLLDP